MKHHCIYYRLFHVVVVRGRVAIILEVTDWYLARWSSSGLTCQSMCMLVRLSVIIKMTTMQQGSL